MSAIPMPMFPTFLVATQNDWDGTRPADVFLENYTQVQAQGIEEVAPFSYTLSRLLDLLEENGEDEYGIIGPTQHAFKYAFRLVGRAENLLTVQVAGSPSVDSVGGIRITWRFAGRELRLICPATATQEAYIYQEVHGGQFEALHNVTPTLLAEKLAWLASGADTL